MEYEFSFWFSIILEDVCDFQIKYQKLQQKERWPKTQQDLLWKAKNKCTASK